MMRTASMDLFGESPHIKVEYDNLRRLHRLRGDAEPPEKPASRHLRDGWSVDAQSGTALAFRCLVPDMKRAPYRCEVSVQLYAAASSTVFALQVQSDTLARCYSTTPDGWTTACIYYVGTLDTPRGVLYFSAPPPWISVRFFQPSIGTAVTSGLAKTIRFRFIEILESDCKRTM
ncbi:hypothetical protein JKP88DRAFT_254107 [Tribonema minus]|uniref:Uncharacterized protein n=1 Tax=Tribonema minus TaxID=303371 RepID=A0A835Z404_9STRA|nr:hypothetical protein JKP88DRAFT_254107 [Tribonema minus]